MNDLPIIVEVSSHNFDTSDELLMDAIAGSEIASFEVGATVCFTGKVRASEPNSETPLVALEIEQYPAMTEASIRDICQQAAMRWSLLGCHVIHRVGRLTVRENIVRVLVASQHRQDAFFAAQFIMDYLKSDVPLWKKAIYQNTEHWVEAKSTDQQVDKKWQG